MKVVLINAPFDIPKMFGFRFKTKRMIHQPLGIGYLAAGLETKGHEVVFIDSQALSLDIDQTLLNIKAEKPGLIGISCFALGRFIVYELVRKIFKELPGLPVVLGGPQITAFTDQVFRECLELRLALCGEADYSLANLATSLEAGTSLETIPGLVWRDQNGDVCYGQPTEIIHNLDALPFPARHLYLPKLYNPMPLMISLPNMPGERIITARGCNWAKCRFCYQSGKYAPCYRRRSPENVIKELKLLVDKHYAEFIFFADDNFLYDETWIGRFCDLIDRERIIVKWSAFGRVDTVTESMIKRAAKSGCVHISYGFESGNQETLDLLCKGITLAQSKKVVAWTKSAGIEVAAFMMIALPRETPQMTENTIRFAVELDTDFVKFDPYHVLEGTPLAEIALQEGRCVEHDNESFLLPTYVPDTYQSAEHINDMVRRAYWRFYFRPRYIMRALWRARKPAVFQNYLNKLWIGVQILLFKS